MNLSKLINPSSINTIESANGGLTSVEAACCDQNKDSPPTWLFLIKVTIQPKLPAKYTKKVAQKAAQKKKEARAFAEPIADGPSTRAIQKMAQAMNGTIIAGVAEVSIVGFLAWKAVAGVRRFRAAVAEKHDEDAFNAIRGAARQVVDSERVADVFAYEIAMLYYGLGSWRRRCVEGPGRYTSYKRNGYGSTLFGIGLLLVVELIAVHLIVQQYWGATGAWVLSILSVYAGIWLLSDWQALRLRPTVITNDALVLRAGVRWEVTIPFARIQSFRRISAMEEKPRGALNLVAFGDAFFEVTTNAPVEAHGAYGMRKSTACVWFMIDDSTGFEEMLSSRTGSRGDIMI